RSAAVSCLLRLCLPVRRQAHEARAAGHCARAAHAMASADRPPWLSTSDAYCRGLFQSSILKDRRERRTAAVRERICPGLTIVRDESPDGHGLHRPRKDAARTLVDAGRTAEQDHSVLCVELGRHFGQWPIRRWLSLGHGVSFCRLSRTTLRVEVILILGSVPRLVQRPYRREAHSHWQSEAWRFCTEDRSFDPRGCVLPQRGRANARGREERIDQPFPSRRP